jgi:hypothetical protein
LNSNSKSNSKSVLLLIISKPLETVYFYRAQNRNTRVIIA